MNTNAASSHLGLGIAYALAAGCMWGLVFVAPALLPDYSPAALSFGRYLAFGLVALVLAIPDCVRLMALRRADWVEAFKLALVGNIIYYLFLSAAIQLAGVPLASVLIGTLPVVIAVCANWQDKKVGHDLPWLRLLPSLVLIGAGIGLVNHAESAALPAANASHYAMGSALALGAVAAWTWYPIRNARWLKQNPHLSTTTWTTAQGLATLPLALGGWLMVGFWHDGGIMGLGARPAFFVLLMLAMGLFASWGGTWAWSRASKLLPTSLTGQLIVFETLAALTYGFLLRGQMPEWTTSAGILLLVMGVVMGVRAFRRG